jgi:ABC-type xylose transport system, periplasmic component
MKKIGVVILLFLTCIITLTGCSNKKEGSKNIGSVQKKIQIGLSFDSFVIERWQRDRDVFVSTAKGLDAEVNVQNANGDIKEQVSQIEYLIDKKMDAIVVVAVDSDALTGVMKKAKDAGIVVIAYDRLVNKANVDLYISFDNEKVGKLMGEALVNGVPKGGNIITIFGPTSDHNVALVEQGFNDVIKDSGLNIIQKVYAKEWLAEEAFKAVNSALTKNPDIDGVMCGNDNLASEAVRALSENRLAGKVVVTGQDADLVACQRIVEGTQTMTVYKPVDQLAKAAAEYAVKMAKGEKIDFNETIDDGNYKVPYVKLEPVAVNKDNIYQVIVQGGFQREEDVYLNVPKD